jgi:peroxiredoxin
MPEVVELHHDLGDDGLTILGVAMDYDPPEQVRALVARRQLPYDIVLDNGGEIANAFNQVRVTPTTILIDPSGGVVWQRIGPIDFEGLREQLRPMLAEERSA